MRSLLSALVLCFLFSGLCYSQNGTVKSHSKISDIMGNFSGVLDSADFFGSAVEPIGDLDGDGVQDLAVGAFRDDDGGNDRGAIWILFLNSNGTVRSHQKISQNQGNFAASLDDVDFFGHGIGHIGDLDNDGVQDIAVGAIYDDDGGVNKGAVYILFLNQNGTVKSTQKISDLSGNFSGNLGAGNGFGLEVSGIGDLDNDGVPDIAVGAPEDHEGGTLSGSVWILFLNSNGTVKNRQKINGLNGNFSGPLDSLSYFGACIDTLADLDSDGNPELVVGAPLDSDGATQNGAIWILYLDTNGTVKYHQKISDTQGNFSGVLISGSHFGWSVANIGDLDGDGIEDISVGSHTGIWYPGGGIDGEGVLWNLFLNPNGTVKNHVKIGLSQGNFAGTPDLWFGHSIGNLGDMDGDGIIDLIVGEAGSNDGGKSHGAVWTLFMNGIPTVSISTPDHSLDSIRVFPTVCSDFIYLEINSRDSFTGSVQIISVEGKEVFREDIDTSFTGAKKLSLSRFRKGIYFLKVVNKESVHVRKIILN